MKRYVYNEETLSYELSSEPLWRERLRLILKLAGGVAAGCFYIWLYLAVFGQELPKTAFLKRKNAEWQAKVDILSSRLDRCEMALRGIENRDDQVYRTIFGLDVIPESLKNSGLGGANRYTALDRSGASEALRRVSIKTDKLYKRAFLRSKALDEVKMVESQAGDLVSCMPAIPPLMTKPGNFRLSSSFGYRSDPIRGYRAFHGGMDFAAPKGTPVFLTGDGVVEKVRFQFHGYGNEVLVDHGYGYKTHYAHLYTVDVAVGQKLCRGDRIGSVGSSGKSTGSHLHYEVLYKGKAVNPYYFMDLTMSAKEYKAMVDERRSEQPSNEVTMSSLMDRQKNRRRNGR